MAKTPSPADAEADADAAASARAARWRRLLLRLAILAGIVFAVHMDLRSWNSLLDWWADRDDAVQPLVASGTPVLANTPQGPRLFLVTRQYQRERHQRMAVRRMSGQQLQEIDVWALDDHARPAWRRRLHVAPAREVVDASPIGVDGDTVWVYARGLHALHQADGSLRLGPQDIESRFPALRGQLLTERHRYGFDHGGLHLLAGDGRRWRIDGSFALTPVGNESMPGRDGVFAPGRCPAGCNGGFKSRGMDLGAHWLGLLDDGEAARLSVDPVQVAEAAGTGVGRAHHEAALHNPAYLGDPGQGRYRLWRAGIRHVSAAPPDWPADFPDNWGTRQKFSAFQPLPQAPEFLRPGLLTQGIGSGPLWLRDPDSVLVLYHSSLAADALLRLARITGPSGQPAWDIELPIANLHAARLAGSTLMLFGQAGEAAQPPERGAPLFEGSPPEVQGGDFVFAAIAMADGSARLFRLDRDGHGVTASGADPPS